MLDGWEDREEKAEKKDSGYCCKPSKGFNVKLNKPRSACVGRSRWRVNNVIPSSEVFRSLMIRQRAVGVGSVYPSLGASDAALEQWR
jgi:hypothetical protein